MKVINEEKLEPVMLGKLDRLMMRLLRAKDLPVRVYKKEETGGAIQVLRLYWESLRNFPASLSIAIFGILTGSIAAVFIPYIFKLFLDTLANTGSATQVSTAFYYVFLLSGVGFIAWFGWRAAFFSMSYIGAEMLANLRQRAASYLFNHSHQFFVANFSGALVQKVNRFALSYESLAERILFDVIPTIVQVSIIMYILSREHYLIALIIFIWLVLFISWNYYFALWKLKYDISRATQDSKSTGQLADSITNHQTVDLYHSQHIENDLFKKETKLQAKYTRFSWQASSVIDGIQSLLFVGVNFAVMYAGVILWQKGQVSIALFVLVQTYLIQLSDRLWSFSRVVRDVYEAFANAKEMAEIMYKPHDIEEIEHPRELAKKNSDIVFKNVQFSFHQKTVIDGLDIHIKPGEKVALVGPSGAGKSTIIKLLFRQYDPDKGSVLIGGENIHDVTLSSLRNILSLVPQDPVLFHRSLLENIRYGKEGATDKEVFEAARLAHCDEFIEKFPLKYNTLVGERGVRLSGGERQRIAIARGFLRNSPILVLDEATSSLDSHSEERIQDALMKLMEGKTTIIIAHRLSTIRRMDRIIVVKDGKVAEGGTHTELLHKKGEYAKLWNIQQGGFLKDEDQNEG